ncbi:helix-turn-helix domain-containing protein [Kocuria turfanensis]|uniref:helix-turn-helix domain-containing protein n=1 Tax=Kocuria turfanensis TaxID=388357 RepID=UPI004035E2F8
MDQQMHRAAFATRDPAEGVAVLDRVFAVREVRRSPDEPFRMELSSAGTGPLRHERLRLGGSSAAGSTDGTGVLRVGHVLGGQLTATGRGDRFARRGPFLFPRRPFSSRWAELDLMTVSLQPAAVQAHARRLLGDEDFRLEFTGDRPVDPAMARYWTATVRHLGRDVLPHEELMRAPLVRAETVRCLVTALLQTFPGSFLERSRERTGGPAAPPSAVRRALAYIEAHLDEDIGLAEIAAAARMSPRGLQVAFRRELGTTPTHRLRDARLDAAHRALLDADPGTTVETVMARWGFVHRGRFAAAYRERHGCNPAATLRA